MTLGRWIIAAALFLSPVACDTFFVLDATVVACDSMQPLEGVAATLHLDAGGYGEEDHIAVTAADGELHLVMNEPDRVTATLTLSKDGYQDWSHQYKGAPETAVTICLPPVTAARRR